MKSNDYENWTCKELLAECKRRGLLDDNNKYKPSVKDSPYSLEKLTERAGFSFDEALAIIDLLKQEDNIELNKKILDLARK